MRLTNRNGLRGAAAWMGIMLFAIGTAGQTTREERTRVAQSQSEDQGRAGRREGGIPRGQVERERGREQREGSEEGVPDVELRTAPGQSRWIPPLGDWKLGVWASNSDTGVIVTRVAPGSAAARQGIEPGDRIVSVGGYQVGYVGDLLYPLGFELQRQAGSRGDVLLLVQNVRNKELMNLPVQLDRGGRERPVPVERP